MKKTSRHTLKHMSDIQHVFYINLDHRTDRKVHVEEQLRLLGIHNERIQRFPACKLTNGALGCSMSHMKCIQSAKENGWSHVLICEDDIQCLQPTLLQNQLNTFLSTYKTDDWDVLLLAGNNMIPYEKLTSYCIQIHHCLTTTCYLVQSHYYDTLIENYKSGIQKLIKSPELKQFFAIDKYWISLQEKDRWFLLIPLTIIQREDYSDIEKKTTNFSKYMLDYNKAYK